MSRSPLLAWLSSWPPAPWTMRGTTLTVWFPTPAETACELLGDLADCERPSRVRFYHVDFEAGLVTGTFREAVVAFPATFDDVRGEISVFMWTDSETYLTWGREVFGWPLRTGSFLYERGVWERRAGSAALLTPDGLARVEVTGPADPEPAFRGGGPWLTPRRTLDGEITMTAVTPTIVNPGVSSWVSASVVLAFRSGHALHDLDVDVRSAELVEDFEIRVGDDVRILGAS